MLSKKKALLLFQFTLSIGLLVWIFKGIDWQNFIDSLLAADLRFTLVALLLMQLNVILQALRLHFLLQSTNSSCGLTATISAYWLGLFHDIYLPANIGGDAFRAWRLGNKKNFLTAASGLLALRIQGALGLVGISCFGAAYYYMPHWYGFLGAFGVVVAGITLLFLLRTHTSKALQTSEVSPEGSTQLAKILNATTLFAGNVRTFALSQGIHLIFVLLSCLIYTAAFNSFDINIPLLDLYAGVPVIMLISMLPVSIQGRGITEWLACFLWAGHYASREQLIAGCLTIYFLLIAQGLFSGVIWSAHNGRKVLNKEQDRA